MPSSREGKGKEEKKRRKGRKERTGLGGGIAWVGDCERN